MFGNKSNNGLINSIHKKALSAVHLQFQYSLQSLLDVDSSVSIHVRTLRFLLVEIFKTLNGKNPKFLWDMFSRNQKSQNLRSGQTLILPATKTQIFGQHSLKFRGSLLWNSLPQKFKAATSVKQFKTFFHFFTFYFLI